jgi:hypothetical protein
MTGPEDENDAELEQLRAKVAAKIERLAEAEREVAQCDRRLAEAKRETVLVEMALRHHGKGPPS